MAGSAIAPRPREQIVTPSWEPAIMSGISPIARSAVRAGRDLAASGSVTGRRGGERLEDRTAGRDERELGADEERVAEKQHDRDEKRSHPSSPSGFSTERAT